MPIRALPNNLEAEESVLGSCFLSKYALQKANENLTEDSFYNERNSKIFSTMTALMEENTPIDITTVTSYLKRKNELTEVGGVEYLTEVLNYVPTASNIDYYIKSVEAWATHRGLDKTNSDKQLIKLIEEVGELSEAHNKEWRDKQIDSIGDIFVVLTIYALQNDLRIDDCIKEAYNTIKDRNGKIVDGVFVKDEDLEE